MLTGAAGGWGRRSRRLLASNTCIYAAPQLQILAAAEIVAFPPPGCSGAACASLTLQTWDACQTAYAPVATASFLPAPYNTKPSGVDRSMMAWCQQQAQVVTLVAPTVIALRSQADPYVAAGAETGCTYDFGFSAKQLRMIGIGCLIPGVIVTCAVYGCLLYLCCCRRGSRGGAGGKQIVDSGVYPQAQHAYPQIAYPHPYR